VDPLAEKFAAWSPYTYTLDNPVRLVDRDGMEAEDIIDINLNTKKITITEAEGDDVVRVIDNGEVKATHTYGKNGSFNSENSIHEGKTSNGTDFSYIKMNNDVKATEIFEFVAKNSEIEWSQTKYGSKSDYLSTSFKKHSEPGGIKLMYDLTVGKYTVREHIHSHPTSTTGPSGYHPSHKKGKMETEGMPNGLISTTHQLNLKYLKSRQINTLSLMKKG